MNSEKTTYVVRVEGFANSYGLGEEITPGVALFRAGMYNLTKEQLESSIKSADLKKSFRVKGDTSGLPEGKKQ